MESDPFEISQAFIEQCERGTPVEELKAAFDKATHALGFRYFACGSHVDPLHPPADAVMYLTYPKDWVQYFSETQCQLVDPVFHYANRVMRPFYWSDPHFLASLNEAQRQILLEAKARGLVDGYTVPIHHPRTIPGSCSATPDSPSLPPQNYQALYLMAAFMYDAMSPQACEPVESLTNASTLSHRERQCLELAAQGKTDWVIGRILGLAERTVHNHIERAKLRLGAATRTQAVVQALFERQISFGDVIQLERVVGPDRPEGTPK